MANFLLVYDPDGARRQSAALLARSRVAFLPHLQGELLLAPHYAVTWAAAASAPIELHRSPQPGSADCLLFGEPYNDAGHAITATDLSARHSLLWDVPGHGSGYYAALLIHPHRGVRVEADVLGVFPLYYWQRGEVLLVASSPELFRAHPLFKREVDLHGVAALLLTSGLVGGRTLWQGVRRLAPDHRCGHDRRGDGRAAGPPAGVRGPRGPA